MTNYKKDLSNKNFSDPVDKQEPMGPVDDLACPVAPVDTSMDTSGSELGMSTDAKAVNAEVVETDAMTDTSMTESQTDIDKAKHVGALGAGIAGAAVGAAIGGQVAGRKGAMLGAVAGAVVGGLAAENTPDETVEKVKHSAENIKPTIEGKVESLKEGAQHTAEQMKSTVDKTVDNVRETADKTKPMVDQTIDKFKETADKTKSKLDQTIDSAKETADKTKSRADQTLENVKEKAEETKPKLDQGIENVKERTSGLQSGQMTSEQMRSNQMPGQMSGSEGQKISLHEERLVADKHKQKTGEINLGKHVETDTAQVSVPVERERVRLERTSPSQAGTPVEPSASDFQSGEVAHMDIYEEQAEIHKQAFVREEVNLHKEVERDTINEEAQVRREELDVDAKGQDVIDDRSSRRSDRF